MCSRNIFGFGHKLSDTKTVAYLIQTFARTKELNKGKQLHARLIRGGFLPCTFLSNNFLNLYSKCGELDYTIKLFDRVSQRNMISWTAMINGFVHNLRFQKALSSFFQMRVEGEIATQFALASVLQACASLGAIQFGTQKCVEVSDACKVFEEIPCKDAVLWTALSTCSALKASSFGKSLHSIIIKFGFECETFVGNALTDMYSKSGDMVSASNVFQSHFGWRNIVSLTSIIDGYVEMDQIEKALSTFVDLQRRGIEPNQFTFTSLIKACSNQAKLERGSQLHGQVVKFNFDRDPFVSSTLVDIHAGMVEDGLNYFNSMEKIYGVVPKEEHYSCAIDLLGRAGKLKEAEDFINNMPLAGVLFLRLVKFMGTRKGPDLQQTN
ncbi:Pentatricopeptide repeat-containing protein, mitochondrial [Glycine soja]